MKTIKKSLLYIYTVIAFIVLTFFVQSCHYIHDVRLNKTNAIADSLLIHNQDSSAYALLSGTHVDFFNVEDDTYALYATLMLQAQDRCDITLNDTLAAVAWSYYKKNMEDVYHAGLAHYYVGKIARLGNDYNTAIYVLKQAQELFDTIGCDRYSFLARDISSTLIWLAQCYIAVNQPDSAIECLMDNRVMPSYRSYANLSCVYEKKSEWNIALAYNDTIVTYFNKEGRDITPILIDRADILVSMGDYISCENILDTITPQDDYERLSFVKSKLLSNIHSGNTRKTLHYFYQYDAAFDSLFIHENEMEVRNIERILIDRNELTSAHNEQKNRLITFIIILINILSLLSLVIVYIKWKNDNIKHQMAELTAHKAQLLRQLLEETIKNNDISNQLKQIETEHIEEYTANSEDKILRKNLCKQIANEFIIAKNSSNPEQLYQSIINLIDGIYEGMSDTIRTRYTNLSLYEIAICEMTRLGFSANDIATILCKSIHTIRSRQRFIREIISTREQRDILQWNDVWAIVEKYRSK